MRTYYGFDHVPTEDEVSDIAAPWRPHRSLGVNLLFAAAEFDSAYDASGDRSARTARSGAGDALGPSFRMTNYFWRSE